MTATKLSPSHLIWCYIRISPCEMTFFRWSMHHYHKLAPFFHGISMMKTLWLFFCQEFLDSNFKRMLILPCTALLTTSKLQ
jgi:hypothetical protein